MRRNAMAVVMLGPLLYTGAVHAQDRPTVFQHGLYSSGDTWQETAGHLQARVAIEPHVTTTNWRGSFDDQAEELQSQLPAFRALPVAVGHSNGGLVSRVWSKQRSLEGIVTIGTPHLGAPILLNGVWLGRYYGSIIPRVLQVSGAFTPAFDESDWIGPAVWPAAVFARVAAATAAVLINQIVPVIPQMAPGSSFLSEINSEENLARESALVSHRVGIVAWDPAHYKGGPIRLGSAAAGEAVHDSMKAAIAGLLMYGTWLIGDAIYDPSDPDKYFRALDRATAIQGVVSWLIDFNPTWCVAISSVGTARCAASDALVPFDSQYYPGAEVLAFPDGPAHTAQTKSSDAVLYQALTERVRVASRAAN